MRFIKSTTWEISGHSRPVRFITCKVPMLKGHCQTNTCLDQSLMTQIYIYILCTRVMYSLHYNYLPITFTSLIILHETYLNIHHNTFISTLSLIFTSQSHIILSGYDSQETLFYLKAKLTFFDKSTDLRD